MKKKMLFVLVLAALVVSGAFAQRVGDTYKLGDDNYTVKSVSGNTVTLEKVVQAGLDGVWQGTNNGLVRAQITISGNGGTLTAYANQGGGGPGGAGYGYNSANPNIRTGSPIIRNIRNTGNNQWNCEFYTYNGIKGTNPQIFANATDAGMSWQQATITTGLNDMMITNGTWTWTFRKQ